MLSGRRGNACSYANSAKEPADGILRPLQGDQQTNGGETGENNDEANIAYGSYYIFLSQKKKNATHDKQGHAYSPCGPR